MKIQSYDIFTLPIKKKKIHIEKICEHEQEIIINVLKRNFLSGFICEYLSFDKSLEGFKERLININTGLLVRDMLMRHCLVKVSKIFNEHEINFVILKGMAMNHIGIYEKNIRFCRDIDILINRGQIELAYSLLVDLGFEYFDKKTKNCGKYFYDMHHLPPLINDEGVIIELHKRVTKKSIFKTCPITKTLLDKKINIDGIYVPCIKDITTHVIYHGMLHDKSKQDPQFLYDLLKLKNYDKNFKENLKENLSKIGLEDKYKSINEFLDTSITKKLLSDHWYITKKKNKNISFKSAYKSIKYIAYKYQIPILSLSMVYFMSIEIYNRIKF